MFRMARLHLAPVLAVRLSHHDRIEADNLTVAFGLLRPLRQRLHPRLAALLIGKPNELALLLGQGAVLDLAARLSQVDAPQQLLDLVRAIECRSSELVQLAGLQEFRGVLVRLVGVLDQPVGFDDGVVCHELLFESERGTQEVASGDELPSELALGLHRGLPSRAIPPELPHLARSDEQARFPTQSAGAELGLDLGDPADAGALSLAPFEVRAAGDLCLLDGCGLVRDLLLIPALNCRCEG